jgi:O-acetyl-ADP-ribose deacetylase (regulator of RNase III)
MTGNLMNTDAEALCNTVNTVGVMGKGIALQFKKAFPRNYQVYRNVCMNGQLKTGELLAVKDANLVLGEQLIINFPTKTHWRKPSEYDYVERGLINSSERIIKKLRALIIAFDFGHKKSRQNRPISPFTQNKAAPAKRLPDLR